MHAPRLPPPPRTAKRATIIMMALTTDDVKYVEKHPLRIGQDVLDTLNESDRNVHHALPEHEGLLTRREAISYLIATLQMSPVARRLSYSLRPVNAQLATIYASLQSDTFDLSPFTPLTKLIANTAADTEIWHKVLQLLADLSRLTPPRSSIPPSFSGTPLRRSSASFRDSKQKREDLRRHIQTELAGRTYEDVPEFITKYFEGKPWSKQIDQLWEKLPADNPLQGFPDTLKPEEVDFWSWLSSFQEQYLQNALNKFYRSANKSEIAGATGERQLDVLLKVRTAPTEKVHHLADCWMVGELTTSDTRVWKAKFTQLATYVRDIFHAQPTRRFVHGFLVFGVQMQLWVFDRSGAYSSPKFNIRHQPEQFVRILAGYAWMTEDELGLDTFVQRNADHAQVVLLETGTGQECTFEIQDQPFFKQPAIACRGTTCFRTVDEKHVVKFAWRPDKAESEIDHLTKAQGVRGVPRLVGSTTITSINELRSGLKIKKLRDLGHTVYERSADSLQLSFTSQSTQQLESLSVSGTKRKAGDRAESPPKRSRSNSQRSQSSREVQTAEHEHVSMSTMPPPDSPQRNRILTCLAITPAGRPLHEFIDVSEVLKGFRDAIGAHRELYMELDILQRDVSHGNIILTDPELADGCSGMLIDYDLAVQISENRKNKTSQEKHMTGTLDFMAIEVLEAAVRKETAGLERTYRHDLESFFYVFLALCIRHGRDRNTKNEQDVLRNWYDASYEDIVQVKRGHMSVNFEDFLLSKFSPVFNDVKELARKLRDLLFRKDGFYTGTPVDPDSLYQPMIAAFENTIQTFEHDISTKYEPLPTISASPSGRKRKASTDELHAIKRQKHD